MYRGSVFVFVWYELLYVHSSFAVITTGCFAFIVFRTSCYCKRSVALPRGLQFVIVVFPDRTHFLFGHIYLLLLCIGVISSGTLRVEPLDTNCPS